MQLTNALVISAISLLKTKTKTKLVQGTEVVAKQLNALIAVAEDLGSVPSIHIIFSEQ